MEQFSRLTSLGEHDHQDQKWHRLVNGMHAGDIRQQMMRNQAALRPQHVALSPHLLQDAPAQLQFQHHLRDCSHQATASPPVEAWQLLNPGVIPPFGPQRSSMLTGFTGSGHNFPYSIPMPIVGRQQEIIHRKNVARLEVNAILQQKDMANSQHKRLVDIVYPIMHQVPGIPPNGNTYWVQQHHPECHPPNSVVVHCVPRGDLQVSSLLQSPRPYPLISIQQRLRGRGKGAHRRLANQSYLDSGDSQWEDERVEIGRERTEGLGEWQVGDHCETALGNGRRRGVENEHGNSLQDDCAHGADSNGSTEDRGAPGHSCSALLKTTLSSSPFVQPAELPCVCPPTGKELAPGSHRSHPSGVMMEELRKWTVEDIYSFIKGIPGCSVYAEVFKDHAIDGETLPLLTDNHLLDTLGIKLGPALKIRSQVLHHLRSTLCVTGVPNPALDAGWEKPGSCTPETGPLLADHGSAQTLGSRTAAGPAGDPRATEPDQQTPNPN